MHTKRTIACSILGLIAGALLSAAASSAQSLGEVARRQREQKGAQAKAGRVYTNDNLPRARAVVQAQQGEKLAPFVPSPEVVVERMLRLAEVRPGDTVYDLGCGDGRIIIMAAQRFGARAVGVELDEDLYRRTRERIQELQLQDKVKLVHGDLLEADLRPATVVTLYLLTSANEKVRPNLEKHLKKGARVVSHDFEIPGWQPERVERVVLEDSVSWRMLYLYRR